MNKILLFLKYRKQILALLKYSFNDVSDYKYLTIKERSILSEKDFNIIKTELINEI
jgi:hypothetical protein